MKIIKGDQVQLEDTAYPLFDSALQYYGEAYGPLLEKTLQETLFYAVKDETILEAIINIIGLKENFDVQIKLPYDEAQIQSYFFVNTLSSKKENVVLYRANQSKKSLKIALSHELYGHSLFGIKNMLVQKEGVICLRNGFHLSGIYQEYELYPMWTEGCVTLSQVEILKKQHIHPYLSKNYQFFYEGAKLLEKCVGKDNLNQQLIHNQGNVIATFNQKFASILPNAFDTMEEIFNLYDRSLQVGNGNAKRYQKQFQFLKKESQKFC